MRRRLLPLWLLALLALAACTPHAWVSAGQNLITDTNTTLGSGQSAGQTFTAAQSGLNGVELYLAPVSGAASAGKLVLHLRSGPVESRDLVSSELPLTSVQNAGYYRFSFPVQTDSNQASYYLQVNLEGEGKVALGSAPGYAYLDGALYRNGQAQDAQLAFHLVYDTGERLLGLAAWTGSALWRLLLGMLLFLFPGWMLLAWLWPGWKALSLGEKLGLSAAPGLAIYPLLLLWTGLAGLALGPLYAWLPILAAVAALILLGFRRKTFFNLQSSIANQKSSIHKLKSSIPDLALLAVLAIVAAVRFYAVRNLVLPMWGDSYQHTLIAQLIVDHGGLFSSWQPYAALQSLTYHFGFHADAAVFHWLSGLDVSDSVLWTGQILNILAVLALYPLAVKIGKNRWAGVAAVLVAGLLSPMPMFYTDWGRYTQLAGQVILPGAIWLLWEALDGSELRWRRIVAAALVMGGLALTHYRVLIFAILFLPVHFLFSVRKGNFRRWLGTAALTGAGGGLLFLPWFLHVYGGKILQNLQTQLSTPAGALSVFTQEYNAIGPWQTYLPVGVWLLLGACLLWALIRRDKHALLFAGWWLLLLLAANPQWLSLPGSGALSSFAVLITAYIPAGVLIGAAAGWLATLPKALPRPSLGIFVRSLQLLSIFALAGLGLWGARQRLGDIQPAQYALATRPDLRAAAWIRANTAPTDRFLVNAFFAYGGSSIAGSDGGWWLPYLAGRQTNLPPLNYGTEQGPDPGYRARVNTLQTEIESYGVDNLVVLADLKKLGIDYIYIGQRRGQVGVSTPPILQPEKLLANPSFRPVYHQDLVWIFAINNP
ncbi:MAG: hypothetical protein M1281_10570 [Chloroflexi bacterium]|nr:hypothetical protein [Chloroflexota bacterium]